MGITDNRELTIDAIVTGTAEDAAGKLGLRLEPGAKDLLLNASLRRLDAALRREALESRRKEIEANTLQLIRYITTEMAGFDVQSGVITLRNMNDALAAFCRLFPNFYPFCPYP